MWLSFKGMFLTPGHVVTWQHRVTPLSTNEGLETHIFQIIINRNLTALYSILFSIVDGIELLNYFILSSQLALHYYARVFVAISPGSFVKENVPSSCVLLRLDLSPFKSSLHLEAA